ncbi:hypothetical protein ACIBG8_20870 [Nonomuraea sp. NPDC050556]
MKRQNVVVTEQDGAVVIRNAQGVSLTFSTEEWLTFVSAVKAGEFDEV